MENEPLNSALSSSTTAGGRHTNPSLPVYSGVPDRQTVQVIQQALTRQPSTAAQYLQQMYAAQQQHLMLQTAALQQQQQHLSSAQLQSLAAAQQASLAANRSTPSVCQQGPSQPPAINLTSSPQIIQRPQTVSSTPPASGITQQAVLLGNTASPTLSASQAQMYLRAQMLIFTPTATVSSIQSEVSSGSTSQTPTISTQVQNLAVRGPAGGQLPNLAMKPATISMNLQPVTSASQTKTAGHIRGDGADIHKRGDAQGADSRVLTGRTVIPVSAHSIITPAFAPQVVQQQKQIPHQFSIQNQPHIQPRPVLPVTQISCPLQPLTHQPQVSQCLTSSPITSQASLEPLSSVHRPSTVLQLPQQCASACGPEVTVQRRLLPPSTAVILHIPTASGMDSIQKHCTAPARNPSISPCLVHIQPQPSPIARAAVSVTETSELHNPLLHDAHQTCQPDPNPCPPLDMTSGNGSSPLPAAATGSTAQNGDNKPPQAVVKPQILTHVIEGFVIQEGAQPFPSHRSRAVLEVERSSLLLGAQKYPQSLLTEKLPQQDNNTTTTDSEMETIVPESKNVGDPPKLKCELCGRVDFQYKFKRSKRFCSMACAKRYNVGCTKRVGLFHPDRSKLQKARLPKDACRRSRKGGLQSLGTDTMKQMSGSITALNSMHFSASSNLKHSNSQEDCSRCSDNSSFEEPLSPMSVSSSLSRQRHNDQNLGLPELQGGDLLAMNHNFLKSDPTKWNVEEVYEFIRSLPGCQEISEEFRAQEIDGQALLLLKEDHLMSTMNIKLGPALKIYARISMLKDS
ncbi:polyhomeotic-like protein 2 isoform X2 [Mixophyes fleayi]|uniref:polyhomeotic-like protein 2 isoform X2 n=1 Tax=Mixophyes fleayi TaxID=3061075 RepID=UPI003F4DF933